MALNIHDDPACKADINNTVINFNLIYYHSFVWANHTTWMGVEIMKYPTDMMLYQEIVFETKPDVIVETGTWKGGSALFLANILDVIGNGKVVTIDNVTKPDLPIHPRITYLCGDVLSRDMVSKVREYIMDGERVMVILDSFHDRNHVAKELSIYSPLVSNGCYLIVEDTFLHTFFDVKDTSGKIIYPGPMEALKEWRVHHPEFKTHPEKMKFFLTQNPDGYLERI